METQAPFPPGQRPSYHRIVVGSLQSERQLDSRIKPRTRVKIKCVTGSFLHFSKATVNSHAGQSWKAPSGQQSWSSPLFFLYVDESWSLVTDMHCKAVCQPFPGHSSLNPRPTRSSTTNESCDPIPHFLDASDARSYFFTY